LAVLAFTALAPVILLVRQPRAWRTRLGTDGKRFFLDRGDGKLRGYPFEALVVSNARQLLVGRRLIPLRSNPGPLGLGPGPLFDEKELAGYVLSRIPPSNRVDPFRFFMRALRAGNRETQWGIVAVIAVAALYALSELFPEAAVELKKAALEFFGGGAAR
jgi:hypothetical protein